MNIGNVDIAVDADNADNVDNGDNCFDPYNSNHVDHLVIQRSQNKGARR